MENESTYWIVNRALVSADEPAVPAASRGLMYGDGCFETCCIYGGKSFKLSAHLKRLREGLQFLGIDYPSDLEENGAKNLIKKLLKANQLLDVKSVVRLQVWRKGGRGYTTSSTDSSYMISAVKASKSDKVYRLATVSVPRIPSAAMPSEFKFTNGINYITAANEARKKNADDALMQTVGGWISETTIANIFWLKNDTVFTPSRECDLLLGITRAVVSKLLRDEMKVPVNEGKFTVEDLKSADMVWICNSVKEMARVEQVDEKEFTKDSAFFDELKMCFKKYCNCRLELL